MTRKSGLLLRLPRRKPFSVKDASNYGVSKASVYRLRDSGLIEQVGPGLYITSGGSDADLDLLEVAHKSALATICLNSALAHHGLIDEIPSSIDLALPRGRTPPLISAPVAWHLFDRDTFNIGRSLLPIDGADEIQIGLYSAERSIVDAFRLRASAGYETGIEALRNWLKLPGSQPAQLMKIASILPRSKGPLLHALEALI